MTNRLNTDRKTKKRRSWNRINLDVTEIKRLYLSGVSENRIAEIFSTARNVIRSRLSENGIHIRNRSEAEKLKWSRMNTAKRINQIRKAHDTVRGKPLTMEHLRKLALAKQRSMSKVGVGEDTVFKFLGDSGFKDVRRQVALDGYNFDFMVGTVAVELNVQSCDPLRRKFDFKKIEDVTGRGMTIIYLCVKDASHIRRESLEELVRRLNLLCKNPPAHGQYWMIRSYRNTYAGFICDFHDRASIESLKPSFNPSRNR